MPRKLRVVVAKPGLDGHDRGAKIIARALRDAGMEVIYTGLHQTAEQIVETVIQEDADAIGLSILSGAHMTLVPRIVSLLQVQGITDVVVTVGGTIPDHDIPSSSGSELPRSSPREPLCGTSSTFCSEASASERRREKPRALPAKAGSGGRSACPLTGSSRCPTSPRSWRSLGPAASPRSAWASRAPPVRWQRSSSWSLLLGGRIADVVPGQEAGGRIAALFPETALMLEAVAWIFGVAKERGPRRTEAVKR